MRKKVICRIVENNVFEAESSTELALKTPASGEFEHNRPRKAVFASPPPSGQFLDAYA
jgi:hypothetical protein